MRNIGRGLRREEVVKSYTVFSAHNTNALKPVLREFSLPSPSLAPIPRLFIMQRAIGHEVRKHARKTLATILMISWPISAFTSHPQFTKRMYILLTHHQFHLINASSTKANVYLMQAVQQNSLSFCWRRKRPSKLFINFLINQIASWKRYGAIPTLRLHA